MREPIFKRPDGTLVHRPKNMAKMVEPLRAGWVYRVEHVGADGKLISVETVKNLMPTVSLNYFLNAALKGGTQYSTLYLGLYDNNITPLAAHTMADILSTYGENQNYTGTERDTISLPAVADGETTTLASPNEFDFTSTEIIRGGFISTSAVWGGGTGVLISAVLFPSPKTVNSGESLRVPVGFGLISA